MGEVFTGVSWGIKTAFVIDDVASGDLAGLATGGRAAAITRPDWAADHRDCYHE